MEHGIGKSDEVEIYLKSQIKETKATPLVFQWKTLNLIVASHSAAA